MDTDVSNQSSNSEQNHTCTHCKKEFKTKYTLKAHLDRSKKCMISRGDEIESEFICENCDHIGMTKNDLSRHSQICKTKRPPRDIKDEKISSLTIRVNDVLQQLAEKTAQLEEKDRIIKDCLQIIKECKVSEDKVRSIERRIRPTRDQYPGKNYVYILTTPAQQEKRVYIFGKTVNLTNRLSTYNKSDEHTVVYHRECKTEAIMSGAETAIFSKLAGCRAMKNRERFILPEGKDIDYFISVVDDCVAFFS